MLFKPADLTNIKQVVSSTICGRNCTETFDVKFIEAVSLALSDLSIPKEIYFDIVTSAIKVKFVAIKDILRNYERRVLDKREIFNAEMNRKIALEISSIYEDILISFVKELSLSEDVKNIPIDESITLAEDYCLTMFINAYFRDTSLSFVTRMNLFLIMSFMFAEYRELNVEQFVNFAQVSFFKEGINFSPKGIVSFLGSKLSTIKDKTVVEDKEMSLLYRLISRNSIKDSQELEILANNMLECILVISSRPTFKKIRKYIDAIDTIIKGTESSTSKINIIVATLDPEQANFNNYALHSLFYFIRQANRKIRILNSSIQLSGRQESVEGACIT